MKLTYKTAIIIGFILLLIFIVIYFKFFKKDNNEYEMQVVAATSGTDEYGRTLEGTTNSYKYTFRKKTIFYETFDNSFTTGTMENNLGKIVIIKELKDEYAIIETEEGKFNLPYGEESSVRSLMFVADGLNCFYTFKIIKK